MATYKNLNTTTNALINMASSTFFLFFSLKYGDCGPFFPEKKNSFGQFAAPLLPFLFLVSKWPKFATKRKRKRKKNPYWR